MIGWLPERSRKAGGLGFGFPQLEEVRCSCTVLSTLGGCVLALIAHWGFPFPLRVEALPTWLSEHPFRQPQEYPRIFRLLFLQNTLMEGQAELGLRKALTAPPRSGQARRYPSYQPRRPV
jgi:hypothetical protein